jgi:hypothetical protein
MSDRKFAVASKWNGRTMYLIHVDGGEHHYTGDKITLIEWTPYLDRASLFGRQEAERLCSWYDDRRVVPVADTPVASQASHYS